ncbi:MAG: 5-oxoprolinase subunit PxpA [Planctomycetota bacterium]
MNKLRIDLNCDLGEGSGTDRRKLDRELMRYITSANIAGGFHSGSPAIMRETIRAAQKYRVAIGIHPGFPDPAGFGRRRLQLSPEEVTDYVTYQIGALEALARAAGSELQHLKLHGALYHLALDNKKIARAVANAVKRTNRRLWILTLPDSQMELACQSAGLKCAREAFADRAYTADGRLVPRDKPGAVIASARQVCSRMLKLLTQGKLTSIDGQEIKLGKIDTICLHSDTPDALEIARKLRTRLVQEGIEVTSLGKK